MLDVLSSLQACKVPVSQGDVQDQDRRTLHGAQLILPQGGGNVEEMLRALAKTCPCLGHVVAGGGCLELSPRWRRGDGQKAPNVDLETHQ